MIHAKNLTALPRHYLDRDRTRTGPDLPHELRDQPGSLPPTQFLVTLPAPPGKQDPKPKPYHPLRSPDVARDGPSTGRGPRMLPAHGL